MRRRGTRPQTATVHARGVFWSSWEEPTYLPSEGIPYLYGGYSAAALQTRTTRISSVTRRPTYPTAESRS